MEHVDALPVEIQIGTDFGTTSAAVASLRDGPQQFSPPVFMPYVVPSHTDLCNQQDIAEMVVCVFQSQVLKDTVAFALLLLGSLNLGRASCHSVRTHRQFFEELYMARD